MRMSNKSTTSNSNQVAERKEMMVIEINFINGQQDDVVVHFGDKPEDLASVSYVVYFSCCPVFNCHCSLRILLSGTI